jgi:hypothetical protein
VLDKEPDLTTRSTVFGRSGSVGRQSLSHTGFEIKSVEECLQLAHEHVVVEEVQSGLGPVWGDLLALDLGLRKRGLNASEREASIHSVTHLGHAIRVALPIREPCSAQIA